MLRLNSCLKSPATVGSACLSCACRVTELIQALGGCPLFNSCPKVLFFATKPNKMCLLKENALILLKYLVSA